MPITLYQNPNRLMAPPSYHNYQAPGNPAVTDWYNPPQNNSGGFDIATLIALIVTMPSLKQNDTTLTAVVKALSDLKITPVDPMAVAVTGSQHNQLIAFAGEVKKQLEAAAGSDREAFASLRKAMLFDLLPAFVGNGGGGSQGMMMLVLILALSGDGGGLF